MVFAGEFQPEGTGTRVRGALDLKWTSKVAICMFTALGLVFVALIGALCSAVSPGAGDFVASRVWPNSHLSAENRA